MDKVILKYLKKEIEYFFQDFKQEDLNTNLFKGNLELTNVKLNNSVLQETLSPVLPYIQVESALVEKFRLKVPFSALKTKPTEVWISKIDIKCREPLDFLAFQNSVKKTEEIKKKEVVKTGKYEYTLVDRILDGLQVTIDHIHLSLSLLGKFKHARPGPWTPHNLTINIYDIQVYSTDEKWRKVPIQETRAYTHGKPHVWHFKESTCKLSIRFSPPKDGSGSSIPMEPVPILEKLPVKFRLTQQRLNVNETIATEGTLFIGEAKFSFTPSQLGHLIYWIEALSSAAFRTDVPATEKPLIPVLERPNTLFTIALDKLNVQIRDKDRPSAPNIQFEVSDLQINRILQSDKLNETITRILLSQVNLRNLKLDSVMMQFYFANPNETTGRHLYVPIPDKVRIHPEPVPEPAVIRYCQSITVRYPEPTPPTASFEYTVNADSFELIIERDGMENLAIFVLQAILLNANRTHPSQEDYKGSTVVDDVKETAEEFKSQNDDGVEFFELDLLANAVSLISLNCKINEFLVKFPTPGGGEKPYLELRFDGVSLLGSPSTAPAVYKRDFLELKSNNGTSLVMPHDFYYQKFNSVTLPEYTFKFNGSIKSLSINMYEKEGAPKEPICSINNINSFCKIYSRSRHIPDRTIIPQVESMIVSSEVSVRLVQKHHHLLVDFLSEHFLYGATSVLKKMLEDEIKSLAIEERKFARAQEEPKSKKKKFLLLPSYMISAAIDKLSISLIDDNLRNVLNLGISATECVLEKHDDRQIIITRIGDLRLHSVFPEIEQSIIWIKKTKLANVAQFRTEWRKLFEGDPLFQQGRNALSKKSYIVGDLEGININLDIRTIYNIQDYLVDILGETIILIDKTQHSHYWWKIIRYFDILYVAGIPSEANEYWRNLRELKLFLEQFSELFDDITWDLSISDIHILAGDEKLKIEPFSMDRLRVVRETTENLDVVSFSLNKVKGSIWEFQESEKKEYVLCFPVDTKAYFKRKKKEGSSEGNTPQWDQEISFESLPNPQINIKSEHFHLVSLLFERHTQKLLNFLNDLMAFADKAEQRRGTRSSIIFDEDILDEARGTAARAYSIETVKAIRKDLEKTKKELQEALLVQTDIGAKNAELLVKQHEMQTKIEELEKTKAGYEMAMTEMQMKMMDLQMKLANAKF